MLSEGGVLLPCPTLEELLRQRSELKEQLAEIEDMRPGSLVPRFRKCGKPNCHCAKDGSEGHGPSWSLTHAIKGKTVTKIIPPGVAVEQTKSQIATFHHYRELSQNLIGVNERICDAKLELTQAGAEATAKKGALKQASRRKSPGNSKYS